MKLEKVIEKEILDFLTSIGWFVWKNKSMGTFDPVRNIYRKSRNKHSINGTSDILGLVGGRFLAIEVKSESGKATDDQRVFIARVNQEGGIAFVTRSLENALEQLQKFFPDNLYIKQALKNREHNGNASN